MKLPAEWEAIANFYGSEERYSVKSAVERCYKLANKPPKELTDAEIVSQFNKNWGCVNSVVYEELLCFARDIEAAHIRKQSEPKRVKFRAARSKGSPYHVEMLKDEGQELVTWEWLEPEQSFEVVLP